MSVVNFTYPKFRYTNPITGVPGVGYKLFSYEEGTSTKKSTWTTRDKTALNTNPIILDSNGEADVWFEGDYKFILAPSTDTDPPTSPILTYDEVRAPADITIDTSSGGVFPVNGSFETDVDLDGLPDNWTIVQLSGGTISLDATTSTHAATSLKFSSAGAGAGYATTNEFYNVTAGKVIGLRFDIISSAVDTLNKIQIYWYDATQAYLSTTDVYNEGAANPTSWTRYYLTATAPANGKYAKVVLTGVDSASTTHGSTWLDNIELDTKFTGEITASSTELNILDGATATAAEINYLDLTTGPGTQEASKAVVADSNVNTGISKVTQLHIGASGSEVQVTATPTELNYSVGVTSAIQTQLNNKAGNTTSAILALYAGATLNAVGSHRIAFYTNNAISLSPGSTTAGSNLAEITGATTNAFNVNNTGAGAALTGTWRYLGHHNIQSDGTNHPAGLFLRTA